MIPPIAKKRGRPAVAAKNAEQALLNLLFKRDILAHILKLHSISSVSLETIKQFPKSVRQFNLWYGEFELPGRQSQPCRYTANSNETLRGNPGVLEDVQHLVNAVRSQCERKSSGRREDTQHALKSQLRVERELTAIANREVIRARCLLGEMREQLESVIEAKRSTDHEARVRIEELQLQVEILEGDIAGLRKMLRVETTLRQV